MMYIDDGGKASARSSGERRGGKEGNGAKARGDESAAGVMMRGLRPRKPSPKACSACAR